MTLTFHVSPQILLRALQLKNNLKRHLFLLLLLLKSSKTDGYDNVNLNVIKKTCEELKTPLMCIFNLRLTSGVFPDKLKIAKVSPIFKNVEKYLLANYGPIPVLPSFSKAVELIIYYKLYTYFTENKIIFEKQFGFTGNSADYVLLELIDQICTFDIIDHEILVK